MNNEEVIGDGNENNKEVVGDENLMNEDSEESDSEGDDDEEDEAFDVEDLQFGRDENCYDDGGLGGTKANLSPSFLEHVEEDVVPDEDGVSDVSGDEIIFFFRIYYY
ncbi:hypothetical protein LIER_43247 [Lithospermum erythrorhizon]|uniref:Uncharacterized protein n=1 Tax=Lithospermum erythrorhizon TaxID=34254 RepID=A0AAV3PRL0_LITER